MKGLKFLGNIKHVLKYAILISILVETIQFFYAKSVEAGLINDNENESKNQTDD